MAVIFSEQTRNAIGNRLRVTGKITQVAAATSLSVTASDLGLNYIETANITWGACSASLARVMSVQTNAGFGIPGSVEASEIIWVDVTGY